MILVRSPLRISIAGGATDIPSYYRTYGGLVVAVAIDKYVYVSAHRTFEEEIILKYSKYEKVKKVAEIEHPIFREALRMTGFQTPQIELNSYSDVPANSGLGSSSSFTCALLKALYSHRNEFISPHELAERACQIEIDILKGNLGKQDQTISAYGGIKVMNFNKDDGVIVCPLKISVDNLRELEDSLLLFYTGTLGITNDILKDQVEKTKNDNPQMIENLNKVKYMAYSTIKLLEDGNINGYGLLTNEHWMTKKQRSPNMTNPEIDELYQYGIDNGAVGGKLVGAGGKGFLLFITSDPKRLRKAMQSKGVEEMRFHFDMEGTKRIV